MSSFRIFIPQRYKIIISEGDFVSAGQTLAKVSSKNFTIDIAKLLKAKPKEALKFLVKKDADSVIKGEIIAKKKGLFSSVQIKSPRDGVVSLLKAKPGSINIRSIGEEDIIAPVFGEVAQIRKDGIIISSDRKILVGVDGNGASSGKLFKLEDPEDIFKIDIKVKGKLVVAQQLNSIGVSKIKALGAKGLIIENKIEIFDLAYIILESAVKQLTDLIDKEAQIVNYKNGHYLIY